MIVKHFFIEDFNASTQTSAPGITLAQIKFMWEIKYNDA